MNLTNLLVLHGEIILPLGLYDRLPQVLEASSSRSGSTQVDNSVNLVVGKHFQIKTSLEIIGACDLIGLHY